MTTMDLQAVVDLTSEAFNYGSVSIRLKDVHRGSAGDYITLPKWVQKYAEAYQIYYAVHEIMHCIRGLGGRHDSVFKSMENKALALWGIEITRKKVYPKGMKINGKGLVCPHDMPF